MADFHGLGDDAILSMVGLASYYSRKYLTETMTNLTSELVEEFRNLAYDYGTACAKSGDHKIDSMKAEGAAFDKLKAFMLTAFDRVRAEGRQGIVNAIKKELASVVVFDRRQITGGLYTDEPMRGPNVETLTFIKREDVEVILKAASGDIAS